MSINEDFQINYWGEDYKSIYLDPKKPGRTKKRKLAIIISFVAILAILPVSIFAISNLSSNQSNKITSAAITEPTKKPTQAPIPKVKDVVVMGIESNRVKVLNNDSYWKITKRTCGTGKYYLSVKEQNEGKALYKDDFVTVDCSL